MQQERAITIPAIIAQRIVRGRVAVDMMYVVGASALIAIAAQIAIPIPFSPVPLTLQPLAVILIGAALGSTRGAAAAALYLLEGFSGLPVFTQGHGGPAWLIGPTAGFLYAYPAAAWLAGWFSERGWGTQIFRSVAGLVAAMLVIYAGGFAWLDLLVGPRAAFTMGIAPFVVADLVKVALAALLLPQAQKLIARTTI